MTDRPFRRVALIGLGLIAGSMAHAIRQGDLADEVTGHARSEATRDTARRIAVAMSQTGAVSSSAERARVSATYASRRSSRAACASTAAR